MPYTIDQIVGKLIEFQGVEVEVVGFLTLSDISELDGQSHIDPTFTLLFLRGELQYPEVLQVGKVQTENGAVGLGFGEVNFGQVRSGNWILVIFPRISDQDGQHEFRVEGLVRLYFGKNCLDERVFRMGVGNGQQTITSGVVLNPMFRVAHPFTNENLIGLGNLAFQINQLPAESRVHFQRSVVWFRNAAISTGADSFIKIWVAIEMLFTNSENMVRELSKKISAAYDISEQKAKETFLIGRLVGLRGKIFHNGQSSGFQDLVVDMLSVLYLDLLVFQISGERIKGAESFLKFHQVTMKDILR